MNTQLLAMVRLNDTQLSWLAIECLLHCAEHPRTIQELQGLTGAANGQTNRAIRSLTVWWDAKAQKVVRPSLHLLQRRRRPKPNRGHRIHLTKAGFSFLHEAGCRTSAAL